MPTRRSAPTTDPAAEAASFAGLRPSSAASIRLDAARVEARLRDEGAWHRAAGAADRAERWVWARPGAQLGRLSATHRAADPSAVVPDLLDDAPADRTDAEQFGLLAGGAVVAHRAWTPGGVLRLAAYERDGDVLLIHRWDAAGRPAGIELVREHADGRLAHTVDAGIAGDCFAERYRWDATSGDLRAVELLAVSASARLAARRVRVTDRFEYGRGR